MQVIDFYLIYFSDLNYCERHQPCQNGGICSNNGRGGFKCECLAGFSGVHCDNLQACPESCFNGK